MRRKQYCSLIYFKKNTDGTSGINACGVEGSDLENIQDETIDSEARKFRYKS